MPMGTGHAALLDEAERRYGPNAIAIYLLTTRSPHRRVDP
jgi:hypothetical protein